MSKFDNSKQRKFLASIPICSIETSTIEERCKFNFSYFDSSQVAGQKFSEWNEAGICSLENLLLKIKDYTNQPLNYWNEQRVGGGSLTVFEYYPTFPKKSDFYHPVHVPHDVTWARFRLGNKVRLIGFVIPNNYSFKETNDNKYCYDMNTFYAVFLDKNHVFYKTEAD